MNTLLKIDQQLSLAIHRLASSRAAFRWLAAFGANELIWCLASGMVYLTLFVSSFDDSFPVSDLLFLTVVSLVATVALPWLMTLGMEYLIGRKRPFQQYPAEVKPLIHMGWVAPSFPSGHATIACALALSLSASTGMYWLFFPVAGIIALSRVAVGVHYVSDILAGLVVGYAGYTIGTYLSIFIIVFLGYGHLFD